MGLGSVNTRTAQRQDRGRIGATVPRRDRRSNTDRQGRELRLRNPDGLPYGVCPMCSQRSSVKFLRAGVRTWHCEHGNCGYDDDTNGPLN